MDRASLLLLVSLLVFASIALGLYAATGLVARRERVRRRFGTLAVAPGDGEALEGARERWLDIDPARLGLNAPARRALRRELLRAGLFTPAGPVVFTLARLGLLVALPLLGTAFLIVALPRAGTTEIVLVAALLMIVAAYLPRAWLARRQRTLEVRYRLVFPNFLDMLVVCVNAGLGLEAALDRAARELGEADAAFRANFELMAAEMRAGQSTAEALRALADRLGLKEARSFAGLLQQTIELGTDVALALTTFADEMRDKRMARAEERAAALPPKLTLPLGLFIFPVVLIVVLAPAVVRVARVVAP